MGREPLLTSFLPSHDLRNCSRIQFSTTANTACRMSGRTEGWRRKVFARKIGVEIVEEQGAKACPLEWLDSFCMRSFTGRSALDDTLPVADGRLEVSFRVDLGVLRADMEDWLTRKFGRGLPVHLTLTEISKT